jgi:hypothetical protein
MGIPPLRLGILTTVSGVCFAECFKNKLTVQIEDIEANFSQPARLESKQTSKWKT